MHNFLEQLDLNMSKEDFEYLKTKDLQTLVSGINAPVTVYSNNDKVEMVENKITQKSTRVSERKDAFADQITKRMTDQTKRVSPKKVAQTEQKKSIKQSPEKQFNEPVNMPE